jgi:hypothetical protein
MSLGSFPVDTDVGPDGATVFDPVDTTGTGRNYGESGSDENSGGVDRTTVAAAVALAAGAAYMAGGR